MQSWLLRLFFLVLVSLLTSVSDPRLSQAEEVTMACDPEPTDMTIDIGNFITCGIELAGDSDIFRFVGTAGQVIILSLADTGTASSFPVAQVFDPQGNPIGQIGANNTTTTLEVTLVDGIYTILITEDSNDSIALYLISLQRLFPSPPNAVSLCYGCVEAAANDPITDIDVFLFNANSGDTVILTLTDTGTASSFPVAQLFDPQGNLVDTFGANNAGTTLQLVTIDGTYEVRITTNNNFAVTLYNLGLQCLFGNCLVQPDISVSPPSLNFGNIAIGASSSPQRLTISNTGDSNLVLSSIRPDPLPSAFGILHDMCSGQAMAPGARCTLEVIFAPQNADPITSVLTIFSNDPDTPTLDVVLNSEAGGQATPRCDATGDGQLTPADALCIFREFLEPRSCFTDGT